MNFVYFTNGSSLLDHETRRQSLRIAEVLSSLQSAQKSHPNWDVMSSVILEEEFRRLTDDQKKEIRNLIQWGLFERFRRSGISYTEVIHRDHFATTSALVKQFAWLLKSDQPTTVFVVGPGVDEIPMILKNPQVKFVDIVERDPTLSWFWSSLSQVANA